MTRNQQPALTLFAIGLIGLGILTLIYHDFAMTWQPVAPWFPGRVALAYLSGVILLLGGVGLLLQATSTWSVRILFPYLLVWLLLKVPALVVAPKIEGVWLAFGEIAVLFAGGWTLFARMGGLGKSSGLGFLTGEKGFRIARILFGLALIPIGISHFVYLKGTVQLIPAWLPFHTGLAYLTGTGHVASGVAVLFSVYPRLAAMLEGAMLTLITLLVWGTAIVAAPTGRLPWTAFFISWVITASVWVVAANLATTKQADRKPVTV